MDMEGRVFERVFGQMRRNYASTRSGAAAILVALLYILWFLAQITILICEGLLSPALLLYPCLACLPCYQHTSPTHPF